MENNRFVILDTTLTDELVNEGLAREFVSKVQQMRKNNGYEVMDQITIVFNGDDAVQKALELHRAYIMKETLAVSLKPATGEALENQNLNGHETGIKLEKQ
jgi:isoleucyl-tRNA synthetase